MIARRNRTLRATATAGVLGAGVALATAMAGAAEPGRSAGAAAVPRPTTIGVPITATEDLSTEVGPAASQSRAEAPAIAAAGRPSFDVSVGVGASFESHTEVPAFAVMGGVGAGILGFEGRLFANQATGHLQGLAANLAVDRLAFDALAAIRPLAWVSASSAEAGPMWLVRVARSITVDLGIGRESASLAQHTTLRIGTVVGGHIDLPLLAAPGGRPAAGDLRVRLAARRMFGARGKAATNIVTDASGQLLAGLAVIF